MQTVLLDRNNIYDEERKGQTQLLNEISEVRELFTSMSILVDNQGEKIDNIESNIVNSNQNTERANTELIKANNYQKKKMQYICYICGCICFIIIIIIIIVINKN
jgi:t-SNARE complex subunit (syntaxin)